MGNALKSAIDKVEAAAPVISAVPAIPALSLRDVCKGYGQGASRTEVLKNINLDIAPGEFVAIVGFSGSGKTTLINMLAGLDKADSGQVLKNGKPITEPGPDRGIVFQSYSLMPWLTVGENVALAVDRVFANESPEKREERTRHYVSMVGLSAAIDKKPQQLSGGMRQRVSVARALATDPDMLLLDEPLSALDALTRAQLQDEIVRIWSEDQKTVLLITNDVDEALMLADRVIPLEIGPGAKLGQSYTVDLPRPRDRLAMNHNQRFQQLRGEITQTLLRMAHGRPGMQSAEIIKLPTLAPATESIVKREPTLPKLLGLRHAALAERIEDEWLLPLAPAANDAALAERSNDPRYAEFSKVVKVYPTPKGPQTVVDGFDMKISKGEFISLIGHSGCGKSTVLSMMAGLTDISEGVIVLDGREVLDAGPDRGLVFQSPSLVPWLTAFENVMLGVARVFPHASPAERSDMVGYYLQRVGLGSAMQKKASELSNGMKQRVGIARAFALQPKLLLLDEPFGMLDALTRWELQEVLMEVWARNRVTAIMVTHDVDEAILLADRVVMMSNGPRAKIGKIMEVPLQRPRTRDALIGHPRYYELREELIGFLEACGHQH
ncbi:MAG: nitrate ABC transporter ATP-binding protein [Gammaproteobacteria bacterium]|nr:nitrate ABC transporter ATP-binding protein [Gammaproteobacteria bacterium]MBU0786215.1 nitrate ABC transporter ATP-binding protein [Gammaproteobacteria bacterium]MBU0816796.1 nitrate ABC transporter ATP-binding protein [Gammaproteobacteria bacterium]MBU1786960.1 nitrate ABC transporter ATP-binding protein [Gammaproteobacteria bacterium]